jgi:hypothetical protein
MILKSNSNMKYFKLKWMVVLAFCMLHACSEPEKEETEKPMIAISQSPFGINAHLQSSDENAQMPRNLEMIHKAGICWVRCDFAWGGIEYPKGTWHFDQIDKMLDQLEKQELSVLGILDYNVSWANPAYKHLDDWLMYVEKTVTHCKNSVRYWQVWNEPNYQWDKPDGDGAEYAALLVATYNKIKEIDPGITVLYAALGGTDEIRLDFIEKSFQAGADKCFDKFTVHPYRPLMTNMSLNVKYFNYLKSVLDLLAKYNVSDKKIWISEMGLPTQIEPSKPELTDEIRETNQALFLQQTILLSLRFGIEKYFWYEFWSPEGNALDREQHFGLVHRGLETKPAYHAYSQLTKLYPEGSVMNTSIEWNQGNFCLVSWTQPGGARVWAVWAPDANRVATVTIGAGLQEVTDMYGEKIEVAQNATSLVVGPGITYLIRANSFEIKN